MYVLIFRPCASIASTICTNRIFVAAEICSMIPAPAEWMLPAFPLVQLTGCAAAQSRRLDDVHTLV